MQLTPVQKRKLQRLIDASVKAHNAQYEAQKFLHAYAIEVWGFSPSDRDCDGIIDGCLGGCGRSYGYGVEEFITEMNEKEDDNESD